MDYVAEGRLRKLSAEKAWATIEKLARYEDEEWNDLVTLREGNLDYENPDIEQLLGVMECKVDTLMKEAISLIGRSESIFGMTSNTMYQLPSEPSQQEEFENLVMNFILDQEEKVKQLEEYMGVIEYTLPVTYLEEVEETLGIPMEVEPLDEPQLEDLGLNTCNYDITLSFKEIPSVDEPKPQLLLNSSPLDVILGDKRGTDPLINPCIPGTFRKKVVDPLTINTPPSPYMAYYHPGTDISEITRKPSNTSKHGHENGRVYKSQKPKPEKVKSTELLNTNEGSNQSLSMDYLTSLKHKDTSSMEKHTRGVGFALNSLTKEAQVVTSRNDSLAILECTHLIQRLLFSSQSLKKLMDRIYWSVQRLWIQEA
ncbi:hypothetical protein Tco_1253605 [Tanacetum coccineum]